MTDSKSKGPPDRDDLVVSQDATRALAAPDRGRSAEDGHTRDTQDLPAGPWLGPLFRTDQLVADRYRILRYVAGGGMGEVYLAEDSELAETVALKTIRPEIARDERSLARFRREILLSRKVTHPNVCRIFDLGHHLQKLPTPAGEVDSDILFFTMEYLDGDTLGARIEEHGALQEEEVKPIFLQVAEGLGALHQAGIVHRDLKCSNVMLVPEEDGVRAVITDFGLAQAGEGSDQRALTRTGHLVGTAAYMSPEQLSQEEIGPASDIYSVGVMLYETLTAHLPFEGETPLLAAVRRLTEGPTDPRQYLPELTTHWQQVLNRCLARDPGDRFRDVEELRNALLGEKVARAPGALKRRVRRVLVPSAALLVVALAVGLLWWRWPEQHQEPSRVETVQVARRPVAAILGFKNTGAPELSWLGTAVSEMLATEMAAGGELRVVPAENVTLARVEMKLDPSTSLGPDALRRLRGFLAADWIVGGSFLVLKTEGEDRLRLDLVVQETTTGETLDAVWVEGRAEDLFTLVSSAGSELRSTLSLKELTESQRQGVQASLPGDPEAARWYSAGLEKLRVFDAQASRALLERAIEVDPSFPLGHLALAEAWEALGYEAKAREEAARALALSQGLPRQERLLVEGRERELAADWDRAVEIYRSLWDFFPDDLEYGLKLGLAATSGGQPDVAEEALKKLKGLPPPDSEDLRIQMLEAEVAMSVSDYDRQQQAAARAAARGEMLGARLVVANARRLEGWAFRSLRQLPEAEERASEAREIYQEVGDRGGLFRALRLQASIRLSRGDLEGARELFGEALETSRSVGNLRAEGQILSNLAITYAIAGDLDEAERLFAESLEVSRASGSPLQTANALGNLGTVKWDRGDPDAAWPLLSEALAMRRDIGHRQGIVDALINLGGIQSDRGDYPAAVIYYEEALLLSEEIGDQEGVAILLGNLAEIDVGRGALDQALSRARRAREIREELGDRNGALLAQIRIGEILLTSGDPEPAREILQDVEAQARELKNERLRAAGLLFLGRALHLQGELGEAEDRIRASKALREELGEESEAAVSQTALAILLLDRREWGKAVAQAREAAEVLDRLGFRAPASAAWALLSDAHLRQGEKDKAAEALRRAESLSLGLTQRPLQVGIALQRGRMLAAEGRLDGARGMLREAVEDAQKAGLVELQLRALGALADAEAGAGNEGEAESLRGEIRRIAEAKGMLLFVGIEN